MARGTVALLGNLGIDRVIFDAAAADFDWGVDQVADLGSLRELSVEKDVVAVLFNARNLAVSWNEALEAVLIAAPRALPIVCAGFSESIPWPELAEAGAYHELRLPIDAGEVKRTLGFIWAATRGDETESAPADAPTRELRKAAASLTGDPVR